MRHYTGLITQNSACFVWIFVVYSKRQSQSQSAIWKCRMKLWMIRLNKFDGLTCLQLIQISQLVYYQNLVIYLLIYNEEIEETKISQLRKRWQMDEMSKI